MLPNAMTLIEYSVILCSKWKELCNTALVETDLGVDRKERSPPETRIWPWIVRR
jgi:hypothetical protein